jgi:hypothetical protein
MKKAYVGRPTPAAVGGGGGGGGGCAADDPCRAVWHIGITMTVGSVVTSWRSKQDIWHGTSTDAFNFY